MNLQLKRKVPREVVSYNQLRKARPETVQFIWPKKWSFSDCARSFHISFTSLKVAENPRLYATFGMTTLSEKEKQKSFSFVRFLSPRCIDVRKGLLPPLLGKVS